jgi:D-alanyl-D-alanine carboxypeptidase/D-alanyl-D-alanine carboxypeptidase (penicillin-binding protein 5/6)
MKKIMIIFTAISLFGGVSAGNELTIVECRLPLGEISAQSAIVMDADSGKILFEQNADEIRAVASLTKVMTAIITLESGDLDTRFPVNNRVIHVEGTTMGLREGDTVTRRALCYGMLLPSGNDAANAAAVSIDRCLDRFAGRMNVKARQLGMSNTSFANPHGLDEPGHHSTARDMATLAAYALQNADFREICSMPAAQTEFGNPPYRRTLKNNNKMLFSYPNCIGVKTGFTDEAKRCLISAARNDGRTLIVVTLNAPDDWNDHAALFDYGFAKSKLLYSTAR